MIPVRGPATSVLVFVLLQLHVLQAQQLYTQPSHNVGCVFSERVCLVDEQCFDDGVLGRCISSGGDENVEQLYRTGPLSSSDLHKLAAEMKRVLSQGFTWEDDYSQCVFQALVDHITYHSDYTPDDCDHLLTTNPDEDDIYGQPDNFADSRQLQDDRETQYAIDDENSDFYYTPLYKDSGLQNPDLPEIIPLDSDGYDYLPAQAYALPEILPDPASGDTLGYSILNSQQNEDSLDNDQPTFITFDSDESNVDDLTDDSVDYPGVDEGDYTVHYVPEPQVMSGVLPASGASSRSGRTKRRSPGDWIVYQEPDYSYEDEQEQPDQDASQQPQSYDFDYNDSGSIPDNDADAVYYSGEARFPLETVFDRRERLDVKKPGPFYSNSQNNFFIDKLLHGDYLDSDLKVDTASGQTEYEFPLLTNDKQKKSDRTMDDGFALSYEGIPAHQSTYLIIYVKDRLSTLTQATSILQAIADQLHLPLATFGEPKLWPNRMSVGIHTNPEQLNATTVAEVLNEKLDSVNGRIPDGLDIKIESFAASSQSDVKSYFLGHSRLFLALFLLTAGISSAILVAGLILILRRRRGKNIEKEVEKEIKSEPVKEYKQLVRDWSRSSRASQSSNNGAAAPATGAPPPSAGAPASAAHQQSAAPNRAVGEAGEDGESEKCVKQPLGSSSAKNQTSEGSRTSSTSSWHEDPGVTTMDISTGHMVLNYMEDHLNNKQRLEQEWVGLCAYEAEPSATTVAFKVENRKKNRYPDKLPYDHNRVLLNALVNGDNSDYINASTVTDHDPRNPGYLVTQGPLAHTTADFWQMVWEQGSVVIVMLSRLAENGYQLVHRYWPEEGSETYHIYEVHLVSEHVWCDDYLVRSLYLKNTQTGETRTVTQFHFLAWPDRALPESTKSLLEFRRKVNKSYRGRSCPIIVHCSDGVGRSGTYVLLDMVLNRMNKGSKEIDIAATLEHIRDQRSGMVQTKTQFEFCLTAVAEETHAILKSLAAQ